VRSEHYTTGVREYGDEKGSVKDQASSCGVTIDSTTSCMESIPKMVANEYVS